MFRRHTLRVGNLFTSSAAAALVKTTDNKQIVSIYIKCKSPTEQLDHDLNLMGDLQLKSKLLILGGNFNSTHISWGDTVDNWNGVTLFKWIHNKHPLNHLKMFLPDTPIRPTSHPSLDYIRGNQTLFWSVLMENNARHVWPLSNSTQTVFFLTTTNTNNQHN